MGPFGTYTEPGIYTQTLADQTVASLVGGLRVPLLIGVGSETLPITDYEIVRGSSSIADNYMADEDVSYQFTGLNRTFVVTKFPIVTGEGAGITTYNPNHVAVTVNNEPAGVAQVTGSTGTIILSSIPLVTDVVKVSYYFKRTDTRITDDDVSVQADSITNEFKVNFVPIVDGSNGGTATTDVTKVVAKVNNVIVTVSRVNGQAGTITLASIPASGDIVKLSYWTNTWQDTYDYLPVSNITNIVRVGGSPGRNDYTNTLDFVIVGNKIQWGNSFSVNAGTTTSGSTPFLAQVNSYLYDNEVFMRPTTGICNSVNKEFTLEYVPTEGTGEGRVTDDVNKILAYVGTTPTTARLAGHVEVVKLSGSEKKLTLKVAPTSSQNVYVTYWHNMIADDTFVLTSVTASTPTTDGVYTARSLNNGDMVQMLEDKPAHAVADPNFATEGVTFPSAGFDGQTIPGYSVEETILLNFISANEYLVLSSVGPTGSNGSGSLGQTYIDAVTGIRFTVMPGSTVVYQAGDLLEFDMSKNFKTSILPQYTVPGLKTTIATTLGVVALNTSLVNTFNKSGVEPAIGDFYYVTLDYAKTEYPIKLFNKIKDVVANFGAVNTDNRLSLAAYLAFSNGAIFLALAQVLRDTTGIDALAQSYIDVLTEVESPIKNYGVKPSIIVPITTKTDVINAVRIHCEKMSTIRYRGERTGTFGFAVGTTPEQAQQFARNMKSERLVGIYPDGAVIGLIDELGNVNEAVVDGSFLAASFAGLAVNPIFDVATPLTHKTLTGFRRLIRQVDAVTMNQTAATGLTVLEDLVPNLLVRHAMTTNPYSVLTREPSVIYIKDFVQQQMRIVLEPFIGAKFLPSIIQDVESIVDGLMNNMINQQIITKFSGTSAVQDDVDPTILKVETFYSPVFPLNWIVMTFNLRVKI